jgi:hypothetical protein
VRDSGDHYDKAFVIAEKGKRKCQITALDLFGQDFYASGKSVSGEDGVILRGC